MTLQNTEIPEQVVGLFDGDTDPRPVMVSIRCTTYNHERYIRETLEGFIKQKTNFRFEAIVHEDASTDGTAAIVREYAEKYPGIIVPIFEKENQYSKRDGSFTRVTYAALRGKYIAYCEGDDYWTDPYKLQKQVDFLEAHPEYSFCIHHLKLYRQANGHMTDYYKPFDQDIDLTEELFFKQWITHVQTLLVHADVLLNIHKTYAVNFKYWGDYDTFYHLIKLGKGRVLKDTMSVYRVHPGGVFSCSDNNFELRHFRSYRLIKELYEHYPDDPYVKNRFNDWAFTYLRYKRWSLFNFPLVKEVFQTTSGLRNYLKVIAGMIIPAKVFWHRARKAKAKSRAQE
jgi:glycosyltransferase involved in cell wall biosynthesis